MGLLVLLIFKRMDPMENWKQGKPLVKNRTNLHFLLVLLLEITHCFSAFILPLIIQDKGVLYALSAFRRKFISELTTNNSVKICLINQKPNMAKLINHL